MDGIGPVEYDEERFVYSCRILNVTQERLNMAADAIRNFMQQQAESGARIIPPVDEVEDWFSRIHIEGE